MKTPKRDYKQDVCPKCGSVVHWYSEEVDNGTGYETVDAYGECCNENCDFSVKGLRDHDGWEDHQQEARWKRKNREARLKHALREMKWQIELEKAKMKGYMRACVTLKRLLNAELKVAATYRKAVITSGTYGHDIEGS